VAITRDGAKESRAKMRIAGVDPVVTIAGAGPIVVNARQGRPESNPSRSGW
jgi:hypothetical protein